LYTSNTILKGNSGKVDRVGNVVKITVSWQHISAGMGWKKQALRRIDQHSLSNALLRTSESIKITLETDILELSSIQVLTRQNVTYFTVVGRTAWSMAGDHCKPTIGFHRDRKDETCMKKAIRREMGTRLELWLCLSLSWGLPYGVVVAVSSYCAAWLRVLCLLITSCCFYGFQFESENLGSK
jgi:hypothetical protein